MSFRGKRGGSVFGSFVLYIGAQSTSTNIVETRTILDPTFCSESGPPFVQLLLEDLT